MLSKWVILVLILSFSPFFAPPARAIEGEPSKEDKAAQEAERMKDKIWKFMEVSYAMADKFCESGKYEEAAKVMHKVLKLEIPPEVLEEYRENPEERDEFLYRPVSKLCEFYEKIEKNKEIIDLGNKYRSLITQPGLRFDLLMAMSRAYEKMGNKVEAEKILADLMDNSASGLKFKD